MAGWMDGCGSYWLVHRCAPILVGRASSTVPLLAGWSIHTQPMGGWLAGWGGWLAGVAGCCGGSRGQSEASERERSHHVNRSIGRPLSRFPTSHVPLSTHTSPAEAASECTCPRPTGEVAPAVCLYKCVDALHGHAYKPVCLSVWVLHDSCAGARTNTTLGRTHECIFDEYVKVSPDVCMVCSYAHTAGATCFLPLFLAGLRLAGGFHAAR
mmetsp:Transcript_45120/g.127368  ORF Transcript_45120/g.127368 Transcript_45120/m.127368 type:complete len:211 (-) Transcript_45120:992-1624(-)